MQLADGDAAARMLEVGQQMSWPADVRSGLEAHASSGGTSFQSSWQLMLRALGTGNGIAGEAESANECGATEIETADATGTPTTNQGIAPLPENADAFAGLSTPVAWNSPHAVTVRSFVSTQPQSRATASSSWPQVSIRAVEHDKHGPVRSQRSEASGKVPETRNAIRERQESAAQNPVTGSPASALFAAPGDTNLPAPIAAPASNAIPVQAVPEFRPDAVTSERTASSGASEFRSEDGSSDCIAQETDDTSETAGPPAAPEMEAASQTETVWLPVSQRIAAPGRKADSSLPDAPQSHLTASQSRPLGEKTSGTISATSSQPAWGGKDAPAVSPGATGSQQNNGPQHSLQAQQIESSESREVREVNARVANNPVANIPAASVRAAKAPSANSGEPLQVESIRSGLIEAPTASAANQWSLESSSLTTGQAHNAAVPEAKVSATNTSAKGSSAQMVNAATVATGWAQAPESMQVAAITKPNAAGIGDRTPLPAAREPFSALDMGTAVSAPRWTHAGGHQAEAGFEDPALGWVGVRADLNGGSVHAELVPATAEAGQTLGAHMAGLSAYLTEQHSPVAVLTLADSPVGAGSAGAEQHMQQGAGQNADAGGSTHAETSQQGGNLAAAQLAQMPAGVLDTEPPAEGSRGWHISVIA
jgi:hypothetical protein